MWPRYKYWPMPPTQSWKKGKKKKEHWCLIFNYLSSLTCGKEAQDGMRVFRKGRKMDSLFLVFMENRKRVGQAHWRIRIAEPSWKHLADLTAPLFGVTFDVLIKCLFQYQRISIILSKFLYYLKFWSINDNIYFYVDHFFKYTF